MHGYDYKMKLNVLCAHRHNQTLGNSEGRTEQSIQEDRKRSERGVVEALTLPCG